jgi:hypothetical protein
VAPDRTDPRTSASAQVARYLGALLLLGTGAIHLQQYFAVFYDVIPVIGPLFLANFVIAALLGLSLLAPAERLFRIGRELLALAALGGIGFAVGTIVGLAISESGALFGFHEHGYRLAIVLSLVFEVVAIIALAFYLASAVSSLGRRRSVARSGEARA